MPAATGASGNLGREAPQLQRLQNLLAHDDFIRAIAIRQRSERGADGIADSLLQQYANAGSRSDNALRTHPGFGEA